MCRPIDGQPPLIGGKLRLHFRRESLHNRSGSALARQGQHIVYAAVAASGRKVRGRRAVDLVIAATALAARLPVHAKPGRLRGLVGPVRDRPGLIGRSRGLALDHSSLRTYGGIASAPRHRHRGQSSYLRRARSSPDCHRRPPRAATLAASNRHRRMLRRPTCRRSREAGHFFFRLSMPVAGDRFSYVGILVAIDP